MEDPQSDCTGIRNEYHWVNTIFLERCTIDRSRNLELLKRTL
jgi:hypothetical protein